MEHARVSGDKSFGVFALRFDRVVSITWAFSPRGAID
jgi:hypothetical protein